MELVTSVTVGSGGAASVTLPATGTIPATYTDLKIVMSTRSTRTGTDISSSAYVTFNGDSGSYYTTRMIEGDGTGTRSVTDSGTRFERFDIPTDNATASTFSNSEMYIPNYTSTNPKSVSFESFVENNATSAYIYLAAGLYSPPSNIAITTITLTASTSSTFDQGSTFYLYGISKVTSTTKATGGIVSSDGTYNYHMFPFSGTFTPTQSITADYLVVAGGGSGGFGGGGAGGLRSTVTATGGGGTLETALSLTAQAYTVTVGAGGGASGVSRANGSDSSIIGGAVSITSTGGGCGGGLSINAADGRDGGSSGGGGHESGGFKVAGVRTASPVQGFNGGAGGGQYSGGGGGGAGAAGTAGEVANNAGAQNGTNGKGGNGAQITAFSYATQTGADNGYYAAGGGGGYNAAGGFGGGGRGAIDSGPGVGSAGTANTGSGGGGGNGVSGSGGGGSGIVIIRYAI